MTRAEERIEKRKFWKEQIHSWQESGLTQKEYCRQHNLTQCQLSYWKRRFVKPDQPVSLVQVNMKANLHSGQRPPTSSLRLVIGNQYRIELDRDFDPVTLQQLLFTLKQL